MTMPYLLQLCAGAEGLNGESVRSGTHKREEERKTRMLRVTRKGGRYRRKMARRSLVEMKMESGGGGREDKVEAANKKESKEAP
ncbi:uncharacterized protein FRV6_07223 [Fusarium oxysporum]|jgi:hypothetical protein|uniref:Uncharacterized protein n=3 Tax=Fusarium oxysporum TaxID=5507 RepID=A0A2H3TIV1_FUSOX|nr:uncharacterized protein FRV6_07223 [Fusarium oxysporum]